MIGRLQALKKAVLSDGKVDWDETGALLEAIRPCGGVPSRGCCQPWALCYNLWCH